jgi:hypothetical protein
MAKSVHKDISGCARQLWRIVALLAVVLLTGYGRAETQTNAEPIPENLLLDGSDWRMGSFEMGKGVEAGALEICGAKKSSQDCLFNEEQSAAHSIMARRKPSNKGRIHLRRPTCYLHFRLQNGGGPYICSGAHNQIRRDKSQRSGVRANGEACAGCWSAACGVGSGGVAQCSRGRHPEA